MNRLVRQLLLVTCLLCSAGVGWSADPPAGGGGSRLRLPGEAFVDGRLLASPPGGPLLWEAPGFASPIQFPIDSVVAIDWPAANAGEQQPLGSWGLELVGGQVLYGELLGIAGGVVRWNTVTPDRVLVIDRGRVQRVFRSGSSGRPLFVGPNGLQGWQADAAEARVLFREEAGQLVATGPAQLVAAWKLPTRFQCELEASWGGKGSWALQVQVETAQGERQTPFELGLLDQSLVLLHDLPGQEDLAWLKALPAQTGSGRIRLYVDLERARFLATTIEGEPLAELRTDKTLSAAPRLRLLNREGLLRVERLRVQEWDGSLPTGQSGGTGQRLRSGDREVVGEIEAFDQAAGEWVLRSAGGEQRIPAKEVSSAWLGGSVADGLQGVIVAGFDGTRLQGELAGVDAEWLTLRSVGIDVPVQIPRERVKSLLPVRMMLNPVNTLPPVPIPTVPVVAPEGARLGWLRGPGVQLQGWLVEASGAGESSGLSWQVAQAAGANRLAGNLTGQLVYREPPTAAELAAKRQQQAQRAAEENAGGLTGMARAMVGLLVPGVGGKRGPRGKNAVKQPQLHLRTGDVLTCTQVRIVESGVEFESPTTSARHIPHDRIKVLELVPSDPDDVRLARRRKDPLLTLPRMQRPSPPTQLVRAVTGDFMRGRVIDLDAERLKIEVRLEEQEIPREVVTHIFWLHPDELEGGAAPSQEEAREGLLVQATRNDGFRQTFVAGGLKAGRLTGQSDLLGTCEVELETLDQVLLGPGIDGEVSKLAYHRWRLRQATDPRYVTATEEEGEESGGDDGKGARLVGKPAPDFKLELLEGGEFQLAKARGRVVVLDFWATWCGPCIKAMPMVEKAVAQFPPEQVQLVAVNLQEQPRAIRAMLDRHQLQVPVALDVDGVAAERYEASAIPQTVVIDPQGKVVRLFVGGANDLEEKIVGAIREVLPLPVPATPAAP